MDPGSEDTDREELDSLSARNAALEARNAELERQLAWFKRQLFGVRIGLRSPIWIGLRSPVSIGLWSDGLVKSMLR